MSMDYAEDKLGSKPDAEYSKWLESEVDRLHAIIKEYIAAYDGSSDPQAVGSTCRLIRAESALRECLVDVDTYNAGLKFLEEGFS